jgi:hypothetical protein
VSNIKKLVRHAIANFIVSVYNPGRQSIFDHTLFLKKGASMLASRDLRHSDSSFWEDKEETLKVYQRQNLNDLADNQLKEKINADYILYLANLRRLFFPDDIYELETLEAFYHPNFFDFTKSHECFMQLLGHLSEFENIIPTDKNDPLYSVGHDVVGCLLELTKYMCDIKIYNPKSRFTIGTQLNFDKQLSTLTTTALNALNVLKHPEDLNACADLTDSLVIMQRQMETPMGTFRRRIDERPVLHKFICAVGLLLGIGLFAAGCFLKPMTFGLSTIITVAGIALIAASLGLYSIKVNNQDMKYKRERDLAYSAIEANEALSKLSQSPSSLFSKSRRSPMSTLEEEKDVTDPLITTPKPS